MPDDEVREVEVPEVEVAEVAEVEVPEVYQPDPPSAPELAPYEQLQEARSRLNAALGQIDGSDLAIVKAEEQVVLLESEMKTAQVNVAFARQEALGFRQRLHNACDETLAAIRSCKAKYPLG